MDIVHFFFFYLSIIQHYTIDNSHFFIYAMSKSYISICNLREGDYPMNLKQLPYILTIAAAGSLSKAAEELNVSQPALSKYLADLERQTGMELFMHQKKRLYPTPAGKVYLEAAREILGMQARTRDSIRLLKNPCTTELHIGISPHRGAVFIAQAFPKFSQYFPNVRLIPHEGYASGLKDMLGRGMIDLALTTMASGMGVLPLHSEEVVLAVPSFHRLAKHTFESISTLPFIDLADCRDMSFVMPDPASSLYEAVRPSFDRAGFQPLTAFSSPNVIMAESMIRSGVGIGLLPAHYMVKNPDITYFRLYQPPHLTACILTQNDHLLTDAERFLIFLELQNSASNPNYQIIWSEPLMEIVREFDYTHYFSHFMES
ncbi:LysR family transcriptional regulator [Clostridium sp. MCC353]|nr:LysR family transcriptional regulator [Clostridium sp. MCC353]